MGKGIPLGTYKGLAIKVNKITMMLESALCSACAVFMSTIEFVPGQGPDVCAYCDCCNANLVYATTTHNS